MKILSKIIIILFLFVSFAKAQAPQWRVYTPQNSGLPYPSVRSLAVEKDSMGRNIIWMGVGGLTFEGTSLNFFGASSKVDNGGFIVIDGNANLKLGDNTTLTFDSPNTYLLLKPNNALNGYEFLTLFHPDPEIRLEASWDYAELYNLMNGESGGEKDLEFGNSNLGFEEQERLNEIKETKEIKRMNKIISDDPVMRKMKKSFDKTLKEKNTESEKQFKEARENPPTKDNLNSTKLSMLKKQEQFDKEKQDQARRNLFELKNPDNEQLEKRRFEDLKLSTKTVRNETDGSEAEIIPTEYKLSQNYPNPFNPTTTISYQIPVDGLVKLNI